MLGDSERADLTKKGCETILWPDGDIGALLAGQTGAIPGLASVGGGAAEGGAIPSVCQHSAPLVGQCW